MEPLVDRPAPLTNEEIRRYSRHLIMPEVGVEGQGRLKAAKVLVVGTGGLGSPVLLYLAAAGVGTIGVVDYDVVDESNLHRQVVHGTKDVGRRKVDSARETVLDVNPHVRVEVYDEALTSDNALRIVDPYDLVVDGTDNFPTRYLVNDACALLDKPNVYGSIFRFEGQLSVFWASRGPNYRDLFPEPPPPGMVPSCAEGGVFGVLPATIGAGQATEAIKLITGVGEPLVGRMQLYDALDNRWTTITVRRDPDATPITALIDYEQFCGVPGHDRVDDPVDVVTGVGSLAETDLEITPKQYEADRDRYRLIDVREPHEHEISRIPGATLIPLSELDTRTGELDRDSDLVLHCKSGMRSMQALERLQAAGFTRVRSMRGGINAYARDVDDSIPTY